MSLADFLVNTPKPWANLHLNSVSAPTGTFTTLNATTLVVPTTEIPTLKTNEIQGIGLGTPQTTKIRVATLGDPAQKVGTIYAASVGTNAVKVDNVHATTANISNSTLTSANISNLSSGNAVCSNLSVSTPINSQGITVSGYTLTDFYTESSFNVSMYGGYLNTTFDVPCRIVGAQRQFLLSMKEFQVPSYMQTGSDDKIYFEVPYLQSYEMSGVIAFSTSNDTDAYNLAVFYKPAGASTVNFSPLNVRHFQYGTYAGQDLYFRPGVIYCSEL